MSEPRETRPIVALFHHALQESICKRLRIPESEDVVTYLAEVLADFLHQDALYRIRDADGRTVKSVAEMAAEGDVLLNADSFEREREVHRHIGNFLLFHTGMFPEHVGRMKSAGNADFLLDPVGQGKASYYIASTFDYPPHDREAGTLRKLSERFDAYQASLQIVRASLPHLARSLD
jgi:hypothetical protein